MIAAIKIARKTAPVILKTTFRSFSNWIGLVLRRAFFHFDPA